MARIGFYGNPTIAGYTWDGSVVDRIINIAPYKNLRWIWLQHPYQNVQSVVQGYATQLAAAGKLLIPRSWWWGEGGVPYDGTGWNVLAGSESLRAVAAESIITRHIEYYGREHIYAIALSEEEPLLGAKWDWANVIWDNVIFVLNDLYDRVKAVYPDLPIYISPNVDFLTDDRVKQVKWDGIEAHGYREDDLSVERNFVRRAVSLLEERGISPDQHLFTLVFGGTTEEGSRIGDPYMIRPCFEIHLEEGATNIGFYCGTLVSGTPEAEHLIFKDDAPDNGLLYSNEYLHRLEMLSLIKEYGAPARPWRWVAGAGALALAIASIAYARRKR